MMASPGLRRAANAYAERTDWQSSDPHWQALMNRSRPFGSRDYTLADREAFDARYAWPPSSKPEPPQQQRHPLAPAHWLDILTGAALGAAGTMAIQILPDLLRMVAP